MKSPNIHVAVYWGPRRGMSGLTSGESSSRPYSLNGRRVSDLGLGARRGRRDLLTAEGLQRGALFTIMRIKVIVCHTFLLSAILLTSIFPKDVSATTPRLVADHRSGVDGSCSATSFSSPTGRFSGTDVGKVIVISGNAAGTEAAGQGAWSNAPLFTTIAAINSSTSITLSDACASAMSGITTAQWDVGTDNTLALQNCVATSGSTPTGLTCNVPAGSYLVSGPPPNYDSRVYLHSNSQLLCASGATFYFPHHDTYNGISVSFLNIAGSTTESVSGAVVNGCTIVGTNLKLAFTQSVEFNYPIAISGSEAAQNQIVGNTIRNGWSDGEISMSYGATATLVSGNTLLNCGLNGITIVSGISNVIENNSLTDCNVDIEPNSNLPTNGPVFGNLLRNNTIYQLNRSSASGQQPVMFSTCSVPACESIEGSPTGADTIAVANNTLVNSVEIEPFCRDGWISQIWLNNATTTSSGAQCTPGTSGCAYFAAGSCVQPRLSSTQMSGVSQVITSILYSFHP